MKTAALAVLLAIMLPMAATEPSPQATLTFEKTDGPSSVEAVITVANTTRTDLECGLV